MTSLNLRRLAAAAATFSLSFTARPRSTAPPSSPPPFPSVPRIQGRRDLLLAALRPAWLQGEDVGQGRHYVPDAVVSSYANTGSNPGRKCRRWAHESLAQAAMTRHQPQGREQHRPLQGSGCDRPSWRGHVQPVRQRLWVRLPWRHLPAGAVLPQHTGRHWLAAWHSEQVYPKRWSQGCARWVESSPATCGGTSIRAADSCTRPTTTRRRPSSPSAPATSPRESASSTSTPMRAAPKDGYWPAGELKEGDASTGKWQELTPSLSLNCAVFPNSGPKTQAVDGDYAWALWRPYSCCQRKGQIFLGSTDFQ